MQKIERDRKIIRLNKYNYSLPGYYFVTICTDQMEYLFGECSDGIMQLNKFGEIVKNELLKTPQIRPGILLDEFAIMPNHLHTIIIITDNGELPVVGIDSYQSLQNNQSLQENTKIHKYGPQIRNLFSIIRGFKGASTKLINQSRNTPGNPVWQTRFYDHIIRDAESLENIREYIRNNSANWERDSKKQNNFTVQ